MAAMTSLHAEKWYHLVNAHAAYTRRLCSSICQFLIYSTFVFFLAHFYDAIPVW